MKFTHLSLVVSVCMGLLGCSRSPEASAPAASAAPTTPAEARDEAPKDGFAAEPAPPAPAAAPAAPTLDDRPGKAAAQEGALEEEYRTLAEAERALNQAKADLDRLALAQPAPARSKGSAEKKDAPRSEAAASGSSAPSAVCENACKAFSSLSRAASAVCRLDGSSGAHCSKAKRVVADSQQRVASCSCSGAGE